MDYKLPQRIPNSNKGTYGKVLNFTGSKNYIGAAYLSSISALKVGCGYVGISTEKNIIQIVSTMLPDAVYLSRKDGIKSIDAYDVIMIGCGLGQSLNSKTLFKKVLSKLYKNPKPLLIDADGLNILAELKTELPQNTIITPHPKEASRLLNVDIEDVIADMESAATKLAEKYKCVVVLKSFNTYVCDNCGNKYILQKENSGLSKAGTGDVLAGIISGFLAQKMTLFEAAKLGVNIHSLAGQYAAEDKSEYSVLASDLPDYLPKVIKGIKE